MSTPLNANKYDKQTNIHSSIQIFSYKASSKLSEHYIADAELIIHML